MCLAAFVASSTSGRATAACSPSYARIAARCRLWASTSPRWLRAIGFDEVDCYWKWLEMALLICVKPGEG